MKKSIVKLLVFVYLLTRLLNLMTLPIFIDEALYVGWTKAIASNHRSWLISLIEDGQPPLFFWLSGLLNKIISNPLLVIRLLSIFFGLMALLLTLKTAQLMFKKTSNLSFWLALLLITSPFVLINDRLGMRDSAVTLSAVMVIYGLTQRFIVKPSNKKSSYSIAGGLIFGLMIKSITWFLPPLVVLSYILFRAKLNKHDIKAALLSLFPVIFYAITRTLPALFQKNQIFLINPSSALAQFKPNLIQLFAWTHQYLSWQIIALVLYGIYLAFKANKKSLLLITIFTLPILVFEVFFAKIFFPRYFLFSMVLVLIFTSLSLQTIWKKLSLPKAILVLILAFIPNLSFSYKITHDFINAPFPAIERWQYITGWPSGYALQETAQKLVDLKADPIQVTDHLLLQGLKYYQPDLNLSLLKEDQLLADYLVINIKLDSLNLDQMTLTEENQRPDNQSSIDIYKINSIESYE